MHDCLFLEVPEIDKNANTTSIKPTGVTEAENAETYGLVGIILMSMELGCLVLLDLITFSKDINILKTNLRAGWTRFHNRKQKVGVSREPLNDASLFCNEEFGSILSHFLLPLLFPPKPLPPTLSSVFLKVSEYRGVEVARGMWGWAL